MLKMGTDETIGGAGAILGIGALRSPWVWLGIAAFVTSLLSWLYALRFIPLNIAFNLAGVLYVLVPLEGLLVMHERVSLQHWAGIVLVATGVVITAREAVKLEQKL
jgi:drug/metabolite transporter (DMT)-like permease